MKCPHCQSENVIKADKLRNKYVTKQGHRCKNCGRYFIERDGFEGMTYPKEIIVAVLYFFVEGLSLSKIREFMYQQYGYWINDGSILNWVSKYGNNWRNLSANGCQSALSFQKSFPRIKVSKGLYVQAFLASLRHDHSGRHDLTAWEMKHE